MSEEKDGKKGRKPYTITKPRESWTKEEHEYFLEALQLYERDWKKIGQHIPTKSIIQIRSHAQKYFIKMAKMGLKEYIPAPSRPVKRTKSKSSSSGNGQPKQKKQKREGGAGSAAQVGEEEEEGEEDEEDGEDGEDEEGEDDEDGQGLEGEDEEMAEDAAAAAVPAASSNGTRKPLPSPSKLVRATSKGKPTKPAAAVMRKPTIKRQESSSSMELDDGSRRSGRKRKANPRYDEDEEGEEQEGEYADEEGMDPDAEVGLEGEEEGMEDMEGGEGDEGEEHEDGQRSNRSSAGPSAYDGAARGLISQLGEHAPSTPLRKAVGGALNSLSQLSPLSQLTQAGSLADITSPHLLPATAYNPKLKPYPGLHQQQRAAAAGIGLGGAKGAGGLALPNRPNPPPQPTPLNIAADDGTQGHDGGDGGDDEDEKPMAPELSKVYTYLASLFDPSSTGHVEDLEKMAPVNKEVVQKLMQNLTTNLPSLSATDASSSASDTISSILNPNARSRQAPKHIRTTSLGNLTNLDVLGSPSADLGMYHNPSVSPTPVSTVINSSTTLTSTGSSPQPFLRTFSSGGNGLTVNITPASGSSSATTNAASTTHAAGSSNTIGNGSGSTLPPAPGGSSWGQDKTRPGFASNALVSRITARSALSPLSVAPLTTNWPAAQGSPTAPSGSLGTYSSYAYASMSPSTNTPLSFVGSPGAFFSPSLGGGVAGGPDTSNQPTLLQFPTSAAPASSTTSSTTTTQNPNPSTSSTLTVPVSSSGVSVTPTKPSAPPTLTTTTPPTSTTTGLSLISPASAAAGNVLAQLISSGSPPKKTEVQ